MSKVRLHFAKRIVLEGFRTSGQEKDSLNTANRISVISNPIELDKTEFQKTPLEKLEMKAIKKKWKKSSNAITWLSQHGKPNIKKENLLKL